MTLAMLTDKERADLLRDICSLVGLDPDKTTLLQLKARIIEIESDAEILWNQGAEGRPSV